MPRHMRLHPMNCRCQYCGRHPAFIVDMDAGTITRAHTPRLLSWPSVITSALICWIVIGILLDLTGCTPAIAATVGML
ncbi:hypothetical protein [Sphingomonas sp. PB4P5]|uniref:hypothetical protein n=1 Tax=Parasphingomonas puruogangriensis TaxID=3096155 RepID=UPI002FCB0793